MIVASIRATDVALGRRRAAASFYIVVHCSVLERRPSSENNGFNPDKVLGPSDPSATVCLDVYLSFEFPSMWGAGEQLRRSTLTVKQLFDHSANHVPFSFLPIDGDVSPCSSILVCKNSTSPTSIVLVRHCLTVESRGEVKDTTNRGHSALSRHRKHGGKRDVESSIDQFEQALDTCPLHYPYRVAAQSNPPMVKFTCCQREATDVPLSLCSYYNALDPLPSILLQPAVMHFARFEESGGEVEGTLAEALLCKEMQLGHENQATTFIRDGRRVGADGQFSVERHLIALLLDKDQRASGVRLLDCFSVLDGWYHAGQGQLVVAFSHPLNSLYFGEPSDLGNATSSSRTLLTSPSIVTLTILSISLPRQLCRYSFRAPWGAE